MSFDSSHRFNLNMSKLSSQQSSSQQKKVPICTTTTTFKPSLATMSGHITNEALKQINATLQG